VSGSIAALVIIALVIRFASRGVKARNARCAVLSNAERLARYRLAVGDQVGTDAEHQLRREAVGAIVKVRILAGFRSEIPPSRALIVPPGSKPRIRYTGPRRRKRANVKPAAKTVIPFPSQRSRCAA
jgi:hypothetical protein